MAWVRVVGLPYNKKIDMKHAIQVLENEMWVLKKMLSNWDFEKHPDAGKLRQQKLNTIVEAINILNK